MLLLPEEHRQLALRRRLFDRFAEYQAERAQHLAVMMDTLAAKDSVLETRARHQRELIAAKRAELVALAGEEEQAMGELAVARRADAEAIASHILRLAESTTSVSGAPEKKAPKGDDEAEIELAWPVAGRTIVQGYGERVNPKTGTITLNPGINISAKSGSAVKVAADGIVSLVTWLPSFGTVVIVEHDGNYRTVYANLASALVSRGRRVTAGQKIGVVGEATDGEYLHFEVWRDRSRRDPMSVLK
jgi:murein DD-endopeptidase MepM/ murein hydrolase activator NlpD